jgi:energy-coupling factor transport system permease protein
MSISPDPTAETPTGGAPGDADDLDAMIRELQQPIRRGNPVLDLDPICMGIILVCLAVIAVALPGVIAPAVICLIHVLISLFAGVAGRFVPNYAKLFAVVGLILFVLRAIFVDEGTVLWRLGPLVVSTGGILFGLRFALVVMALCGAVVLYFALTPMKTLMLSLETRGVTPRATYVVLASFQSITDLGRNARTVMDAQRSRGIETEGGPLTRIRAFGPVLAPVFLAALNQTEERALALDARAFNARGTHTNLAQLRPVRPAAIILTVVAVLVTIVLVLGGVLLWR